MTKRYIGVKVVDAWREARAVDDGGDPTPGYAVKYADGYISWSPKRQFEEAYRQVDDSCMSFGLAIEAVKKGMRVARKGWNGKGMFIFLVGGSTFEVNREPLLSILGEGTKVNYHAHIDMKTADEQIVPWLASQTDMLADDWTVVD